VKSGETQTETKRSVECFIISCEDILHFDASRKHVEVADILLAIYPINPRVLI
jgi:hypothetical protein